MSIRNRVMLATLGLAVVGFVVTLGAQDDKVIIVRDGSVEINAINSKLKERDSDRRQKWSKKADLVQVFRDPSAAQACTTALTQPVKFRRVDLTIGNRGESKSVNIKIGVTNETSFLFLKKLEFEMPGDWRFAFRQYKHALVEGNQSETPRSQNPTSGHYPRRCRIRADV